MPLTKQEQKRYDEFELLTQRLRQKKSRFRPEYVREIVVWLIVQLNRYRKTLQAVREQHRDDSDPWMAGNIRSIEERINHINALIVQTTDNWSTYEWHDAVSQFEAITAAAKPDTGGVPHPEPVA